MQMLGKGGNAGEYVQDDGAVLSPVTEDAVHDIVYHLAVTQRSLALRHGDEHEVQLVRQIYEPLVHLREVDSHIEDDESYLAPLCEPAYIRALERDIADAVEKAGDDDLAAEEFALGKNLVHKDARVRRLQDGDGRDYLGESPVSAEHLCPAQGGQLEQVPHADAHIRHLLELFPRV